MTQPKMNWTPPIVKYLEQLVSKQEYSSIEIARFISEQFNVSCNKNQVIGKADRLGMRVQRQGKRYTTPRSKFWTMDKLQILHQMWEDNVPVGDIGYKFGISGGSVARAARAYNLPKRDLNKVRIQSSKMKVTLKLPPKAPGTISIERSMDKFLNPEAKKLTFEQLKRNSCRYIVGDTMTTNFRYCGADVPAGYSVPYCEVCRKIVYYPSKYQQKTSEQGEIR